MRGLNALGRSWDRLWFQEETTRSLDLVRIGVGLCLLVSYASSTPDLFALWGDEGWVPRAAIELYAARWDKPSVHFWFSEPWHWMAFHGLFLIAAACLALGSGTGIAKWIVWVGHISYAYRNPLVSYGVDVILASATFLLLWVPVGQTLSVDRWRSVRRARREGRPIPEPSRSVTFFTVRRLLQIQLASVMFYSGVAKLRGDDWWSGDALWIALNNYEFAGAPLAFLAGSYPLLNAMTHGTVVLEIAFAFLIWQRGARPFLLVAIAALHAGIAVLMGLYLFSAAMLTCHSVFLRREWLDAAEAWLHERIRARRTLPATAEDRGPGARTTAPRSPA